MTRTARRVAFAVGVAAFGAGLLLARLNHHAATTGYCPSPDFVLYPGSPGRDIVLYCQRVVAAYSVGMAALFVGAFVACGSLLLPVAPRTARTAGGDRPPRHSLGRWTSALGGADISGHDRRP